MELKQKISPHPTLGVDRVVKVTGFTLNLENAEIVFYYQVLLEDSEGKTIMGVPNAPSWVIDNSYQVTVRTADMEPVKVLDEETGEMVDMKQPAFNNFVKMFEPFVAILKNYIILDDEETHRFDF